MELQFLGTGAGMPSKARNVSSVALKINDHASVWLFDCGEGTQHQMLHTPIKPGKITKIMITHLHGDHLFGLPGLLGSRSFLGTGAPLHIYGPIGLKQYIDTVFTLSETHVTYPLIVHEIQEEGLLFTDEGFSVEVRQLDHVIPCYGYRIQEHDRPGRLKVEKLRALNIPAGPLFRQLKEGQDVWLEDGTCLKSQDFVEAATRGRIVTILGDTRPCAAAIALAQDADVLLHEATSLHERVEHVNAYGHSSAQQAGSVAAEAKARFLILQHVSARYSEQDEALLIAEAKTQTNHVAVARDFACYRLDASGTVREAAGT
ncbi:ribonuclease Z [Fictibacillus macauensis ZFHKF-1]|uniref:Ribonuclease Z n=1 Tax=Fictibacillus macauensis ZFHKF-1 TaxID=1196324 RepID=I8J662_9BACL|nr:ribonuclease Z [Fictibacillus macauensis]EIT87296.1 ribonuclease Z [Fictibacillus macauensis ZFHKF-1]